MAPIGSFRDSRLAIIWGNAAAPSTSGTEVTKNFDLAAADAAALGSLELLVENYTPFSINQNNRRLSRQSGMRHRSIRDTWNDTKGSIPGLSISMPATKETLDLFLYMAFQRVTEGTTPFVKSFEYPNTKEASLAAGRYPEFNNDEGAFCGFVIEHGAGHLSSAEEIIVGCVPTRVRISCSPDAHDGQLWIDADFIGREHWVGGYTGTITSARQEDADLLHIQDIVCGSLFGQSNVNIYGFEIEIQTGLKFVPFGGTGAGSKDIVMLGPNASGSVDYIVDDSSPSTALLALQIAQFTTAANSIYWGDGTCDEDGELNIAWVGQITDIKPVGNEERRFVVSFDCADSETELTSSSSSDALTVSYCNGIDRGW